MCSRVSNRRASAAMIIFLKVWGTFVLAFTLVYIFLGLRSRR